MLFAALTTIGINQILPWPDDRPWNFVLHDGDTRRIDLHFYEAVSADQVHYGAFIAGTTFAKSALTGEGVIAGMTVCCEQPDWALRCHDGYPPRPVDRHDITRLCARFGMDLPPAYH